MMFSSSSCKHLVCLLLFGGEGGGGAGGFPSPGARRSTKKGCFEGWTKVNTVLLAPVEWRVGGNGGGGGAGAVCGGRVVRLHWQWCQQPARTPLLEGGLEGGWEADPPPHSHPAQLHSRD